MVAGSRGAWGSGTALPFLLLPLLLAMACYSGFPGVFALLRFLRCSHFAAIAAAVSVSGSACIATENSVDKPSRFTNMRIGMFTRESCWRNMFPKLKGRAAEVKHFGPALMKAFAAMMDRGNVDHQSIHLALQMSVKIDRILDDYPDEFTLPPKAASEFQGAVFVYLNQVTSLANRFNSAGRMVFNITVKTHCLAHFGCRVHCLNPRRGVFRVNVLCSSSEKS